MATDLRRPVRSTLVRCLLLIAFFTFTPALRAQDFEVLWAANSGLPENGNWDSWQDWEKLVDLGGSGIQRDRAIFFYETEFGLYPTAGLHQCAMDPSWMARHRASLLHVVNSKIPDPNYSGLAIIDYEAWGMSWDTTRNNPSPGGGPFSLDQDYKDDWRTYVQQYLPASIQGLTAAQAEDVYEDLYNRAARAFIIETIQYAKSIRPAAKWGYYLIPCRSYYLAQDPDTASNYQTLLFYEIGWWLYPQQDAFFPDIYSLYQTLEGEQPVGSFQDQEQNYMNYLTRNIQWALDAAQGRPVYPVVWMRYHENAIPYSGQFVNTINMEYPYRVANLMSAKGLVIWDVFRSTQDSDDYQAFVDTRLRPFLRPYLGRCPADVDGDQAVTIDDLLQFLVAFEAGKASADLCDNQMTAQPDSAADINDLLFYLIQFANGC